ncbi:MAG TPA: aminotransferase class I/II-fold pyridoxal phosphate-dependent enzyme [Candidatus Acidoferrales bacterium]|nr:aminotransferase class I/II-fold pyridoxal phosphate-dependent enzyme [Candidatus Acidoferrales bacterium]
MQIAPFEMERWQSVWENRVELNVSESGVDPMTLGELLGGAAGLDKLADLRLGYPQTNGSEELRGKIAALYAGARMENVLVTTGCAEANFLVTWLLIEPGDEVVFMMPNYMQVHGLAQGFGASVKPFWLHEYLRWAPDMDDLAKVVTNKTKLIAVCNPNNPTGATLAADARRAICDAAAKVGAFVLADEVYRGAELEGETTPSFWGEYDRLFCTGGLSKAYGLPGLRTGWILGPPAAIERLWSYHDYVSMAPTMTTDRLASAALESRNNARILERTRGIIKRQYPIMHEWARKHSELLTHVPPRAGAIVWYGYKHPWKSAELGEELRRRKNVLIQPGIQMGLDGYFRIGFAGEVNVLQQALGRIDEWFAESLRAAAAARGR